MEDLGEAFAQKWDNSGRKKAYLHTYLNAFYFTLLIAKN